MRWRLASMLRLRHRRRLWAKQQVRYLFHVDLQEGYSDSKLRLVRVFLNVVKYVAHTPWNNTAFVMQVTTFIAVEMVQGRSTSEYRMSLATACLTVSHYNSIESIKHIFDNRIGYLLICCFLVRLLVQDAVKVEVSLIVVRSDQWQSLVVLKIN